MIARASGQPLADVLALPKDQVDAWAQSFDYNPPGDYYTQRLLATLIILMYDVHSKDNAPRLSIHQVAPWLVPAEERENLREERKRLENNFSMDIARNIALQKKQRRDEERET